MLDSITDVTNVQQEQLTYTGRFKRTLFGEKAKNGTSKPKSYIPRLLLKGQAHHFYGPTDCGKSWVALWASVESVLSGRPVIYFDDENGAEVAYERMVDALDVPVELTYPLFWHYAYQELTTDRKSLEFYVSLMDSFTDPGLIVFDSWVGFLSLAGLSEDKNDDLEIWSKTFINLTISRGWTVILLDHTGHSGDHARGASRKSQVVQVQYQVKRKKPFDRTSQGRIELERKKDRLAALPKDIKVSLGNTPFVFEMESEGGSGGSEYLPANHFTALKALAGLGITGAKSGEWKGKSGLTDTSFYRARTALIDNGYVDSEGSTYRTTKLGNEKVFATKA